LHLVGFLSHFTKYYVFEVFILECNIQINPLNAELNPICHLLALLGAHHILHVSRIRVKHKNDSLSAYIYTEVLINP